MTKNAISQTEFFIYQHYRIIHGIRIALSFVLAFILARLLHLPEITWILITLVVIMGPVSFLGNVVLRAGQRILGTAAGAISGLLGLYIELYSYSLMLLWCAVVMFVCGYFTLSKRPYAGLLIGITLAVVMGAPAGDFHTALWRTSDVIIGAIFALCFVYIIPQRASVHWRILFSENMQIFTKMVTEYSDSSQQQRQDWQQLQRTLLSNLKKMEGLLAASRKEMGTTIEPFNQVQQLLGSIFTHLELMAEAVVDNSATQQRVMEPQLLAEVGKHFADAFNLLASQSLSGKLHSLDLVSSIVWHRDIAHRSPLTNQDLLQANLAINGYVWLFNELNNKLQQLQKPLQLILTQI